MCSRGTAEVSSAVTQPVQTWVSPSDWRFVRVRPGASRLWLLEALCPPQNLFPSVRNLHLNLVPEHRQRGQVGRGDKQRKQRCREGETGRVGREDLELETTGVVAPGPGEGPCTMGARAELSSSGFRARVTVGASLWS